MQQRSPVNSNLESPSPSPATGSQTPASETKESKKPIKFQPIVMPTPVFQIIASMLNLSEVEPVALTSHTQAGIFRDQALRRRMKDLASTERLFRHFVQSEKEEIKKILDRAKDRGPYALLKLLTAKSTITTAQGHQFEKITLFQLALWHLNQDLCKMLCGYFGDECLKETDQDKRSEIQRALQTACCHQWWQHCYGDAPYVKMNGAYHKSETKNPWGWGDSLLTTVDVHNMYLTLMKNFIKNRPAVEEELLTRITKNSM